MVPAGRLRGLDHRMIGCGLGGAAGCRAVLDDLHVGAAFARRLSDKLLDFGPRVFLALAGDHAAVEQKLAGIWYDIVGMAARSAGHGEACCAAKIMGADAQVAVMHVDQAQQGRCLQDGVDALVGHSGMGGPASDPHQWAHAAFVRGDRGARCRFSNDAVIDDGRGFGIGLRAKAGRFFIRHKCADQGARPVGPARDQNAHGLQHGDQRAFGIATAAAEELAASLAQAERIGGPAVAGGHHIDMGVEGEGWAGPVLEHGNDIGAPGQDIDGLGTAAHGGQLGNDQARGFRLAARRVLGVDGNEAVEAGFQPGFVRT